jgi:P-type Ca2+ transporter type 2C
LTGESVAVDKATHRVAADARLGERSSMLFKGTALTRGSGAGVVVATGLSTELGRVAQLVEEAEPGSSPLEKRLARLSAQLIWATLTLTALLAGVGVTTGKDAFVMVEAAIALAVAAIPEGLPIVATRVRTIMIFGPKADGTYVIEFGTANFRAVSLTCPSRGSRGSLLPFR